MHVGVELASPIGSCDGSVDGVFYFEARADHGAIVRAHHVEPLKRARPASADVARSKVRGARASRKPRPGSAQMRGTIADANCHETQTALREAKARLSLGDRVRSHGLDGVIRYIGVPQFATDEHPVWIGIELDKPAELTAGYALKHKGFFYSIGRNDGTVMGEEYFCTAERHALFAAPSEVRRLLPSGEILPTLEDAAATATASNEAHVVRYRRPPVKGKTRTRLRRERLKRKLEAAQETKDNIDDAFIRLKAKELQARAMANDENVRLPTDVTDRSLAARKRMELQC
ncbi:Clip1 protein [Thecamonas trahens ATCC 50062]|uniref:Clip1 protein n=1 Tax=Thecamonas trahens ATCC 50062 TaxID=461836 RepID=A0A0L0D5E4_THETB|nr:Clip1 protein [Thecamonas trahens ATCC 50062]KNC47582.1 Clip1 protein [Thecamonas trahens ATCC 50062]|eukprot:XP_013759512.1 Clip1 protein [Thecamonas trahens ATCC 50062]